MLTHHRSHAISHHAHKRTTNTNKLTHQKRGDTHKDTKRLCNRTSCFTSIFSRERRQRYTPGLTAHACESKPVDRINPSSHSRWRCARSCSGGMNQAACEQSTRSIPEGSHSWRHNKRNPVSIFPPFRRQEKSFFGSCASTSRTSNSTKEKESAQPLDAKIAKRHHKVPANKIRSRRLTKPASRVATCSTQKPVVVKTVFVEICRLQHGSTHT